MSEVKRYATDVLVVGGGGAATAATIAAHEGGARTMLAVKGQFGVPGVRGAGATSNPIGDFWTIRTVGPKGGFFNPPELVLRDMLQTGLGMADPKLCGIFVDEVSDAVKRLKSMGMKFKSQMLATMEAKASEGKTNAIVEIQKAVIAATNTHVLEHANLTDLIVKDGGCVGAVGVDDDGAPFVVEAGAVVLATGGVGQLFTLSFNPPGNTGDGYAMALRAGADLVNMEFMQQGLATTWPNQAIVMLYEMEEPYRLLNADGQTFLHEYLPEGVDLAEICRLKSTHWPVSCRDATIHIDRAIKAEVHAGRATPSLGVFLDLASAKRGFEHELFVEFMRSKGIDIEHDLVQVQVHHHTSNGGVRVDEHAQSSVPGLYAVGETAGWQGADRLGGTMLGGSQVFGRRAGSAAAEFARTGQGSAPGSAELAPLLEPIERARRAKGTHSIDAMHRTLQRVMWDTLIVEKDAPRLATARAFIQEDRERLTTAFGPRDGFDCVRALEQRNLLDVAEVIVEAADRRTESRGSHYRSDFPSRDDERWLTNIFARREHGELALREEWICRDIGWEDHPDDVRIKPWG